MTFLLIFLLYLTKITFFNKHLFFNIEYAYTLIYNQNKIKFYFGTFKYRTKGEMLLDNFYVPIYNNYYTSYPIIQLAKQ